MKRPSAQRTRMALSTTKQLETKLQHGSTRHVDLRRLRVHTCATPVTAISGGEPTARSDSSTSYFRTSVRRKKLPVVRVRSRRLLNISNCKQLLKSRKPFQPRWISIS